MARFFKSRRILIPDVPPPTTSPNRWGVVIAGLGVLCATVMLAISVFLGM
jgi:hypothetical protein